MANRRKSTDSQEPSPFLRGVPLPEFLSSALRNAKGTLLPEIHNTALFLEGCPDLPDDFYVQWDEMAQTIVTGQDLHPLCDVDVSNCQRWLAQQGIRRLGEHVLRAAILIVADQRRFNPLTELLNSLVWDRVPRLATWLHDFLGTPDDPYHAAVGTLFLRQMIARAKEPGCKADYMLVLEGPQRRMKSTVCEILSLGYFSDSLPELSGDSVRVAMHLRGPWLIEVSELHAFSRAEASRLKQFLSSKVEKYTPKYGRAEVSEKRRCVFIGTTNKSTYLRDETGGSRFWPVKCGTILIEELRMLVHQLLAEAWWDVSVCQKPHWPGPEFEEKIIGPQQDARYDGDMWEALIADWDFMVPDCDPNGRPIVGEHAGRHLVYAPYKLADIAFGALGKPPGHLAKAEEMRLAKSLEFMGWQRAKRTMHGIPWNPPTAM
jgi:hypothetical protein